MDLKKAARRLYLLRFLLIYGTMGIGSSAAIGARADVFGSVAATAEPLQYVILGLLGSTVGFALGHLLNIPNDALRALCVELARVPRAPGGDGPA